MGFYRRARVICFLLQSPFFIIFIAIDQFNIPYFVFFFVITSIIALIVSVVFNSLFNTTVKKLFNDQCDPEAFLAAMQKRLPAAKGRNVKPIVENNIAVALMEMGMLNDAFHAFKAAEYSVNLSTNKISKLGFLNNIILYNIYIKDLDLAERQLMDFYNLVESFNGSKTYSKFKNLYATKYYMINIERNNINGAEEFFTTYLQQNECNHSNAYCNYCLGKVYMIKGDYNNATIAFNNSIAIAPKLISARLSNQFLGEINNATAI